MLVSLLKAMKKLVSRHLVKKNLERSMWFGKAWARLGKIERFFLILSATALFSVLFIGVNSGTSAKDVCAKAAQVRDELADLIGSNNYESNNSYVPIEKRRQMVRDENVKRDVMERYYDVCSRAIEHERFEAEYNNLNARFDLGRIERYSEEDRRRIYKAADVPAEGPRSMVEKVRVLKLLEANPMIYR